ncbi:MAG: hypothetical protein K8R58_03705, partial [Bacteroidales bacterium]|nr:hypothetical protein [Bacteroidales bacterium]
FSQFIANKYFNNPNIYVIHPPFAGSTDINDFKKSFENALEIKGSYKTIFNNIKQNSIIIIDDLELWWEKSQNGFDVIEVIIGLISEYSNKCLFIVNTNIHSYKLINKIRKIEDCFLNNIELEAFNAEQLKNIILLRHRSTDLKIKLKNKKLNILRSLDYARLFSKYFNYSKGNVGLALHTWIANITDIEEKTLIIKAPKAPDLSILNNLQTDWLILLIHFILHKRLTIDKLARITRSDKLQRTNLIDKINNLKRAGVIIENNNEIYELNPFLYISSKNKLIDKEML